MSYKVLVIPEDPTKDEHILLPLLRKVLADAGKPNATVSVCRDPNFQGIDGALNYERVRNEVVLRNGMTNLFILFVDRDSRTGREAAVANLGTRILADLKENQRFLGLVARQEVEIFPIAGHDLSPGWSWRTIRADGDVKNTFFVQLAEREDTTKFLHQGRKQLMAAAMRNWSRIKSRCPEETTGLIHAIQELS